MGGVFVLLLILVLVGRLVLPRLSAPSVDRSEIELASMEGSFFDGMGLRERHRIGGLLREFATPGEHRRMAELQRLREESQFMPLPVVRVWQYSRGLRNICAFRLSDGRQLEMNIYDPALANRIVASWRRKPHAALRLTWVASLGWRCSLHLPHRPVDEPPEATALAWSASVTTW